MGYVATSKATHKTLDKQRFMASGLVVDTLRGFDATGMFLVEHDGKPGRTAGWYKKVGTGVDYVGSKDYDDLRKEFHKVRWCVGHNRAGTRGANSLLNAHPYQAGGVTLVHNGTLDSLYSMPMVKDVPSGKKYPSTDSWAITYNMAYSDPKEVLESLKGSYVLIWHDSEDDSLNFARNASRPMVFAKAGKDMLYFGSEAEMLHWLSARHYLGMTDYYRMEPGKWLKFKADSLVPEVTEFRTTQPVTVGNPFSRARDAWKGTKGWVSRADSVPKVPKGNTREPVGPWHTKTMISERAKVGNMKIALPAVAKKVIEGLDIEARREVKFNPLHIMWGTLRKVGKSWTVAVTGTARQKATPFFSGQVLDVPVDTARQLVEPGQYNSAWTCQAVAVRRENGAEVLVLQVETYHAPEIKEGTPEKVTEDMLPGPRDTYLSRSDWLIQTANGCSFCSRPLVASMAESIDWIEDDPVCWHCAVALSDDTPQEEEAN